MEKKNILIIYDTLYGNTQKIASSIGDAFSGHHVRLLKMTEAGKADLTGINLLVVGSPTHAGRPSRNIQAFLRSIPPDALRNTDAAAFDTSIPRARLSVFMRFVIRILGYAAKHIAKALRSKGAVVKAAENFYVTGTEGPLLPGEEARAKRWAASLV